MISSTCNMVYKGMAFDQTLMAVLKHLFPHIHEVLSTRFPFLIISRLVVHVTGFQSYSYLVTFAIFNLSEPTSINIETASWYFKVTETHVSS